MVDFHSHALPGIDDGATDVVMSAAMLELSEKQGVDAVVLTPHYYFSQQSIDDFLEKREEAYKLLTEYIKENNLKVPKLIKGAEVKFSYELLESDELSKLCIEDTNALLLEMPFSHWNTWLFDKLFEATVSRKVHFIIAHAERYIKTKKDIKRLQPLFDMNCTIQINSDSLVKLGKKGIVRELIKEGKVNLLGSDAHNNTTRKSTMNKAYKHIRCKYKNGLHKEISMYEKSFFERVDI